MVYNIKLDMGKPKIVLICMDKRRELPMLELLKKEFENTFQADVWIIGSLADVQKIYYLLNHIKPEVVFISQIIEEECRNIASYVRRSGAILCVLPAELTYVDTLFYKLFKHRQTYNKYLDYYFLPGPKMYRDILRLSDISKNKMFVTGNPRVDMSTRKNAKKALSRKKICAKYSIPSNRENIFIFTSFVINPVSYIKTQKVFKGSMNDIFMVNKSVTETRDAFVRDVKKLCLDFPKCNIILKPHPLEDESFYKNMCAKNFYMIRKATFNDIINSIDLAVHWCSTVATECWVTGIKTLQYIPVPKYKSIITNFDRENPVFFNYSDLRNGIWKYLTQNLDRKYLTSQKKYLRLWYYKTDGLSVKRIALKIKDILHKNTPKELNYRSADSKMLHLFIILEKIMGIRLSRWIVSLVKKDYNWRYAADNFVFSAPNER